LFFFHNAGGALDASRFSSRVRFIVDHHKFEGAHSACADVSHANVWVDEGIGSACTIVAEMFQEAKEEIPANLGTWWCLSCVPCAW
jgi:nanoRNase/pAp phosphatase (c-di-AMP/oligoRNAs hydrolase)